MKGQHSVETESRVMVLFLCKKNVGGVTILLCTLSDDALYLYTKFKKKSQKVLKLLSRHYFQTKIF